MKVVFLSDGAYAYASGAQSAVGGAERDQWLLATALASFDWSVTVGVRAGLEPHEQRLINGVQFVGMERGQILYVWHRFLAANRPDWLFWECADHLFGAVVAIAKLLRIRTIFHTGLDRDVEPRNALTLRPNWWPLYAWGLSRTDRILVQHEGQRSKLPARWQSKAFVFPKVCILPGVVGDRLGVKPHCSRSLYVAWVAMLREPKRPDILIQIAQRMPGVQFIVCGGLAEFMTTPGYSDRIVNELRALPNVNYRGQVAPEVADQIIADAALLLSTSDEEGFPNTFTQAWSAGTPVVTLKLDPDHLIERLGLGAVSGSVERAKEDISELIASPVQRQGIAARARNFIEENYSATAVVRLFEGILQGVIK